MNYDSIRKKTKAVSVGATGLGIGGSYPLTVQSMTNTPPDDFEASYRQAKALQDAGCDILRLSAPTKESVGVFPYLKERGITMPLVADIHFDHRIALEAMAAGADKIRINPGNIGANERVRAVATEAERRAIPIRIGVNSGSLEKEILAKHGAPTPAALAESAMYHISLLERYDFHRIAVSVKSSSVYGMIEANRLLSSMTDYPLHLGVTEAGGAARGGIKSAMGLAALLTEGIGDTLRVSLTADPVEEIACAKEILSALGLGQRRLDLVSCPTCARTKTDMIPLLRLLEEEISREGLWDKPVKVALMGCAVNGPGEAREADVGIACGVGEGLLFRRGETVGKVPADAIVSTLIREIKAL